MESTLSADAALEFVRFCHRRRRVGWPELYDEMCAVASRGVYKGWGFVELAEHGIGFGLSEMPRLAAIAGRVAKEEAERRSHVLAAVMAGVHADPQDTPADQAPRTLAAVGR